MKKILIAFGILIFFNANFTFAGDSGLQAQIDEMKRVNAAQATNLANAINQIQEMVGTFQSLSGRIDQSLHDNDEQTKVLADNQKRLDILEEKTGLLVKQLEELKVAGLMTAALGKNLKEFQDYEQGIAKINAEEYKDAATTLKQFLATYPKSSLAENAQFWIGQSFYSMRDFSASISEFQKVVGKYPNGGKVTAALLKQGYAFYEMQSFDESKAFLTKLAAKFPATVEATAARDKIRQIDTLLEQKAKEAIEKKTVQ